MVSVIIGAGGTGGHLAPAIAVAGALRALAGGAEITFVGTRGELERRMVPAAGYELRAIDVVSFASTGTRRLLAPPALLRAVVQARRILRERGASVVIGMGGYPSLPTVAAAAMEGVPSVLHEQNAIPGLANTVAARLTPHVAVTFPDSARAFPANARPRIVGMPLREPIAHLDRDALRAEAIAGFGLDPARATLFVTGGSQGARRLNEAAVGAARAWRDRGDLQMLVAAGAAHAGRIGAALAEAAGSMLVRCVPFVERMELAYAAADLALCRAGAATVCEVAAAGLPAILVPYPHGRRGEQTANARALVRVGAAVLLPDPEATSERVATLAGRLLGGADLRAAMAAAGRAWARRDAAEELARWALSLAAGEEAA